MGGYAQAWYSRVNWGGVIAGVAVALSIELVLSILGLIIGFSFSKIKSTGVLQDIGMVVSGWAAVSKVISLFFGGYVAARIVGSQSYSDGLWYGFIVWSINLLASLIITTATIAGLFGFAGIILLVLVGVLLSGVEITTSNLRSMAKVTVIFSAAVLATILLSLGFALLGGILGSNRSTVNKVEEKTD